MPLHRPSTNRLSILRYQNPSHRVLEPCDFCDDRNLMSFPRTYHHAPIMRVGVLCRCEVAQIEWAHRLGFRSVGMLKFFESPLAPPNRDWKPYADQLVATAKERGVRISALGALYKNPLDPKQTE